MCAANQETEGSLPGEELVQQGLSDLANGQITDCSLLLLIAAPRLRRLGLAIPELDVDRHYEHELYGRLEQRLGTDAHSHYNSLIRRIVSYAHALEREQGMAEGRTERRRSKGKS